MAGGEGVMVEVESRGTNTCPKYVKSVINLNITLGSFFLPKLLDGRNSISVPVYPEHLIDEQG